MISSLAGNVSMAFELACPPYQHFMCDSSITRDYSICSQKPLLNADAEEFSRTRSLIFGQGIPMLSYFVHARNEAALT